MLTEKYNWSEKESAELSDFLSPMLEYYPPMRATARQCLQHSWLEIREDDDVNSSDNEDTP